MSLQPSEWLELCAWISDRWPEHAAQRGPKWAEAWWPDVKDFDVETLRRALRAYSLEDRRGFPPDGGALVRLAAELSDDALDFDEAWREILEAMRQYGSYRTPQWSCESVRALVRALGWRALCLMPEDNVATTRAQARMMWDSIRRRNKQAMLGIERRGVGVPAIGPGGRELPVPDLRLERGGAA